jgi:hypothetical protein
LICRNAAAARAVPGGSHGLAQNKSLIHRLQNAGDTNYGAVHDFIFSQPRERFVGTQHTCRDDREGQLHPIMIAGQPQAAISVPMA